MASMATRTKHAAIHAMSAFTSAAGNSCQARAGVDVTLQLGHLETLNPKPVEGLGSIVQATQPEVPGPSVYEIRLSGSSLRVSTAGDLGQELRNDEPARIRSEPVRQDGSSSRMSNTGVAL